MLPFKDYLHVIRPHLNNVINDHKTQGEWNCDCNGNQLFLFQRF